MAAPAIGPASAVLEDTFRWLEDLEAAKEVGRILAEAGVVTEPPTPSWGEYFQHLWLRWLETLAGLLNVGGPLVDRIVRAALWLLLGVAALVAIWVVVRWVQSLRAGTGSPSPALTPAAISLDAPAGEIDWRRELELRLASGRVAAALEALWWWLATKLEVVAVAEGSWTGRELLRRSGRLQLRPLIEELEWVTYGPIRVDTAQVRGLFERAQREIAR